MHSKTNINCTCDNQLPCSYADSLLRTHIITLITSHTIIMAYVFTHDKCPWGSSNRKSIWGCRWPRNRTIPSSSFKPKTSCWIASRNLPFSYFKRNQILAFIQDSTLCSRLNGANNTTLFLQIWVVATRTIG